MSGERPVSTLSPMPDMWFVIGLAMGLAVTGFCALGSFERGVDNARRAPWMLELAARRRAVIASRSAHVSVVGRVTHA